MNNKKILIALLVGAMSLTMLTACKSRDKDEDIPDIPNETTPERPIEDKLPGEDEEVEPRQPESQQEPTPEKDGESEANPETAVMSRDWEEISTLDSEKKGWGPGGPVDDKNRSQGATAYQDKYGKYDADFIAPEDGKKIYLTFDEGYENGYSGKILDVLKEKNVSAVFFITGDFAQKNTELVQRMIDEGHIVGNHTWSHPSIPDIDLKKAEEDIQELHNYVKENFDYDMKLFRFPSGEFNEQSLLMVKQLGYRSSFWSFAYKDWLVDQQPAAGEALEKLQSKIHPGAIYLLHAVSSTNWEILDDFIDDARADGYEFCNYYDMYKKA